MKIRVFSEKYIPIRSCVGCDEVDNYALSIDKETREKSLVLVGKTNLFERIQTYRDSTDVYKLLASGSFVIPEVVIAPGIIDNTRLPKNIFEATALINTCKKYYNSLPDEIKTEVTYNDYIASFGSDSLRDKISNRLTDYLSKIGGENNAE